MKVREIMTQGVETIDPNSSLKDAADKMRSYDIGILPVYDQLNLIGMVTDRDIVVRAIAKGLEPAKTLVKDVMTEQVEWCYEDDNVEQVVKKMDDAKIRRMPVFDHENVLVGIFSIGDLSIRGAESFAEEVLKETSKAGV